MAYSDPTDYGNPPGAGPLRPGGVESSLPQEKPNLPSTLCAAAERQQPALTMVRDLAAGAERVRDRSTHYLPQSPGEEPANYRDRLNRSVFMEAFGDTIDGLTGFVFRKDPVVGDDVPAPIMDHWENIDNAGTHGDVFARERLQDALTAGHGAILVEYPDTQGRTLSLAEEAPLRPYWVPILKENILSWRTTVEDGRTILTQVVLRECTQVPDGDFGEKEQTRYRVLYRDNGIVGFRLLEITDKQQVIVVASGLYPTQDEIPLAEITTSGKRSLFDSRPPLLGLAYLNVAHYQQWSDAATSRHMTCVPILATIGAEMPEEGSGKSLIVGPNTVLSLPMGADAKYVAHDGAALDHCETALQNLKGDMATLGLSMLAPDKRAAETAAAKRIDKSTSDSALSVTARGLQDAVERALGFHAKYMKLESGGSIQINRDFEDQSLEPQMITALSALVSNGQLTLETLWKMLIAGETLPDDFDETDEKGRLDAEAEIARQKANEDTALAEKAKADAAGTVVATKTDTGYTMRRGKAA